MRNFTVLLTVLVLFAFFSVHGQVASPPAQTKATVSGIDVTIDYSQPALKGRPFGTEEFHPNGSVWRNGANKATWIEISADAKINGEVLKKGKYSFFVIPNEGEWTLIFNSTWDQWGAFSYDSSKDVLRVNAKVSKSEEYSERYTIKLSNEGNGSLNWGDMRVDFTLATSS